MIFATFYIYGADNKPVWYTAVMNWDGATTYSGTLFSEQGTYFGAPWNPADMNEQPAGTATFIPSTANNYQGHAPLHGGRRQPVRPQSTSRSSA